MHVYHCVETLTALINGVILPVGPGVILCQQWSQELLMGDVGDIEADASR